MATQVLTLVNQALAKVGENNLASTELDSGTEWHQRLAREAVQDVIRRMYKTKKDGLLKASFTITTSNGVATYSAPVNGDLFADTNLRLLTSDNTDAWLNYLPESEALEKYIDFNNLTLTGRPNEWWFTTTATPGTIYVRFNPIPDAIYTITGFKYSDFTRVASTDVTTCTDTGDAAIQAWVESKLANSLQKGDAADLIEQAKDLWSDYICEDLKTDDINVAVYAYQNSNETGQVNYWNYNG